MEQQYVFTLEQVSPRKGYTPEGFLICYNVPLARTGEQEYLASELPKAPPDDNGTVTVIRPEEVVFHPIVIESLVGKPVCIMHPEETFITPVNWKDRAVGTVLNPRRGEDEYNSFIVGDLLIYTPEAIKIIETKELEQISVGYQAKHEIIDKGLVMQTDILCNHVAIVSEARAGDMCTILDSKQEVKIVNDEFNRSELEAFIEEEFNEGLMEKFKRFLNGGRKLMADRMKDEEEFKKKVILEKEEEFEDRRSVRDEQTKEERREYEKGYDTGRDYRGKVKDERMRRENARDEQEFGYVINDADISERIDEILMLLREHDRRLKNLEGYDEDNDVEDEDMVRVSDEAVEAWPEREKIEIDITDSKPTADLISKASILLPSVKNTSSNNPRAIKRAALNYFISDAKPEDKKAIMNVIGKNDLNKISDDKLSAAFELGIALKRHQNNMKNKISGVSAISDSKNDLTFVTPKDIQNMHRDFFKNGGIK